MGNGTHKNLLHECFLTRIINKVCNEVLFVHAHVALEYFNFKRENGFKKFAAYTSFASVMIAAEQLLEEMGAIHI